MKYLALLLLTSCGVNGSSNSVHEVKVSGSAEIEQRIVIDFEVCNDLDKDARAKCIDDLIQVLATLNKGGGQ